MMLHTERVPTLLTFEVRMKPLSHDWKQRGRISVWRYTENRRNYGGWHLTADAEGADSVTALLVALNADPPGASRGLVVSPPSRQELGVPNNRQSGTVVPRKLRLMSHAEADHWTLRQEGENLLMIVGADWILKIRDGATGIAEGRGDFYIGENAEDERLWFWWQPGTQ